MDMSSVNGASETFHGVYVKWAVPGGGGQTMRRPSLPGRLGCRPGNPPLSQGELARAESAL
jgi:hypothetical protein